MKRILKYDTYIPLGTGLYLLKNQKDIQRKWIYLIPSGSLMNQVKEKVDQLDRRLLPWIEIMTFDQMMRTMIIGSTSKKMLTPSKQELLVKKAVEQVSKEKEFLYFRDSIHTNGWLHQIEIWLGEVRRAGITPKQLTAFWENSSQKYQELQWIYQAYHQVLNKFEFIDHEEPYFLFLNDSKASIPLDRYQGIITDQFYDFSPIQMNVLNKMGDMGLDIHIHLAVDNKRTELFHWTANTTRYLTELGFVINENNNENLYENQQIGHLWKPAISQIVQNLFSSFPDKTDASSQLVLLEATGMQREMEMIAAELKSLVWNKEQSLEQIAIIIPQLERYEYSIQQVMKDAGIPIRLAKKEKLIRNPFVQAIITLLKALNGHKDHWFSLIFSPYFQWPKGVNPHQWMMIFRECGAPITRSTWNERFKSYLSRHEEHRESLVIYDDVMQLLFGIKDRLEGLNSRTNQTYIEFLKTVEDQLKTKEKMKDYFLEHVTEEAAFRDVKAYDQWQQVKEELKEMDDLIEEGEELSFRDWLQSLILACEQSTYSYSQGKKAGVHILKPNQIRGQQFNVVFVAGLVEGEFPRAIKNDWLLPDDDRRELRQVGAYLTLSQDYEKQQKYQYFQSLAAASNQIYLVYSPKTEEGKEQLRSFFIDEVFELFHEETIDRRIQDISEVVPDRWEKCTSTAQYVNKLYYDIHQAHDHARKKEAVMRKNKFENEYSILLDSINHGIEVENKRDDLDSNYDGLIKQPQFVNEIKEQISKKIWSTTQLNEANICRFSYFSTYLLRLTKWEEKEESLTAIEKGDLFHRILQRFFDRFRFEKEDMFQPENHETYRKWLYAIAEEEWEFVKNQELRFLDPVLSDLDLRRILHDAKQILDHETYWRGNSTSSFYPQFLELSFGLPINQNQKLKGEIDPSSIVDTAQVQLNKRSFQLRGKIDRVDRNSQGQFVVYDYKNGHAPSPKDIREVNNLQLPIYLFVLETLFGLDLNQAVGASFYTKGEKKRSGEKSTDNRNKGMWKSDWLDHVGLSKRMKSHTDEEGWKGWLDQVRNRIEQVLNQIENGDFAVLPTQECPSYCPYQYICRKDEERIKRKRLAREEE